MCNTIRVEFKQIIFDGWTALRLTTEITLRSRACTEILAANKLSIKKNKNTC